MEMTTNKHINFTNKLVFIKIKAPVAKRNLDPLTYDLFSYTHFGRDLKSMYSLAHTLVALDENIGGD